MPDLFIERVVELDGEHPLPLRFFRPESAGDDFACLYEVEWPHGLVVRSVYGVHAVQALILALTVAHAELLNSPEGKQGRLTRQGMRDLGLPTHGPRPPGWLPKRQAGVWPRS